MTEEQLLRGRDIQEELELYKTNKERLDWMLAETVVPKRLYLELDSQKGIFVPKSLFKVIAKLIDSEYIQVITKLENEFNDL